MCHEDCRNLIIEAGCPVPDDRLSDLLRPDVILLFGVEAGIIRSEYLFIESGNRNKVRERRGKHLRFCDHLHTDVRFKHLLEYVVLAGAVVVGRAPHDDHEL